MSSDDFEYYRERAAIERRHAEDSTNPHAVEIHLKLAQLYEQLIGLEDRPSANQNLAEDRSAVA